MIAEFTIMPKNRFEVEGTLKKYHLIKTRIELIEKDLNEDMYSPSAACTEMGSLLVTRTVKEPVKNSKGKFEKTKTGKIRYTRKRLITIEEVPVFAHSIGLNSDPTYSKAQKIIAYKKRVIKELDKMKFKVKVIDDELNKLQEQQAFGTDRQKHDASLKAQIITEIMNANLPDSGILTKLKIPERTYYRWKNEIITSMLDKFRSYKSGSKVAVKMAENWQ